MNTFLIKKLFSIGLISFLVIVLLGGRNLASVYRANNAGLAFADPGNPLISKTIQVQRSRNIELFGLMMQLDMGADLENNHDSVTVEGQRVAWSDWYSLLLKNYRQYKNLADAPVMKAYRQYQQKDFYNDFFIHFLLEADDVPKARLNVFTDSSLVLAFSENGNWEEGKQKAEEFLGMLNDFYEQSHFAEYLDHYQDIYRQLLFEVKSHVPAANFVPTMEDFYQQQFRNYVLVPSLNIPTSMGFGKTNGRTNTVYNIFGPFGLQALDQAGPETGFRYPEKIRELSVHEFGHSFVNPAVDKVPAELIQSSAYLFESLRKAMAKKAYPNWKICLYEHFVRAGEILIARELGDEARAATILNEYSQAGFIYLPVIVDQLAIYAKNKQLYPSYDEYVPVVIRKLMELFPPRKT
jgi:Domain of unknown function (DUF4932)